MRKHKVSWHVLSVSFFFLSSRHVTSRHVTSRHVTPRHVMSCHVTSRHVMSRHVTSRPMSRHVMSCHVMSRHVTSHHVTSLLPFFFYIDLFFFIPQNKPLRYNDHACRVRFSPLHDGSPAVVSEYESSGCFLESSKSVVCDTPSVAQACQCRLDVVFADQYTATAPESGPLLFTFHGLCCVVLCCAVLCCAVLCCAVLCCAVMPSTYHSPYHSPL